MNKKFSLSLIICLMFGMLVSPNFDVSASWAGDVCIPEKTCKEASKSYTQPYCYSDSVDYVKNCMWTSLSNNLSSLSRKEKSTIIKDYCKAVLSQWQDKWRIYYALPGVNSDTWDWQQTFDSQQSLFVYAFCSSFKDKNWKIQFLSDSYDLLKVFKSDISKALRLEQKSRWKNLCSLGDYSSLSECDMSLYATEIFSAIMSDVFKIKYAQVMHVDSVENFANMEDRITSFLSGYFNMTEAYRNLQTQFPQTVDVINSNQKYYKSVLDKLKIINNSELVNIAKKSGCSKEKNMRWIDFIACAMHWSQSKWLALDPTFVTRFYNELMNYATFIEYYQNWSEIKMRDMNNQKESEKSVRIIESEATNLKLYSDMQIEAAKQTLKDLEELNLTYPLHIWLLLYQEKAKKFRDTNLSPIITIFYSLSEKLQNVQLTK